MVGPDVIVDGDDTVAPRAVRLAYVLAERRRAKSFCEWRLLSRIVERIEAENVTPERG